MTPYYDVDGITIYHGDCRDVLPELTFDTIVADPPYGINYEQTIAGAPDYDPIIGDDDDELADWIANYTATPRIVFGANHFPRSLPTPGQWICWDKRCSAAADRMIGSPFELAWRSGEHRAGIMYRVLHGGVVNADSTYGNNQVRHHPMQKPVTLMLRIINELTNGIVIDPFMGSGSTLVAAKAILRPAIGIEIDERYCEIAAKRLAQGVLNFGATA